MAESIWKQIFSALQEHTKAKGSDINERIDGLADNFTFLPSPHDDGTKGFFGPCAVGDAINANDAPNVAQVRDGALMYGADFGTVANKYKIQLSTYPDALVAGMTLTVGIPAGRENTGASILQIFNDTLSQNLGEVPFTRLDSTPLTANDVQGNRVIGVRFNGTSFVLLDGTYAAHDHDNIYYRQNVIDDNKTDFDNHLLDSANPHQVTKTQVGLGNVMNSSGSSSTDTDSITSYANSKSVYDGIRRDNMHYHLSGQVGLTSITTNITPYSNNAYNLGNSSNYFYSSYIRYMKCDTCISPSGILQIGTDNSNILVNVGGFTGMYPQGATSVYKNLGHPNITGARWYKLWSDLPSDTSSDERLKKDITNIDGNFIYDLRPVEFRMKDGDNKIMFGLIAQEVDVVLPNNDYGIVSDGETMGISYTQLISPMIKCIQDLEKRIATLEGK